MLLANSCGLIKLQKSPLLTCQGPWHGKQGVIKLVPQTQLVGTFTLFGVLLLFLGALHFHLPSQEGKARKGPGFCAARVDAASASNSCGCGLRGTIKTQSLLLCICSWRWEFSQRSQLPNLCPALWTFCQRFTGAWYGYELCLDKLPAAVRDDL